MSSANLSKFIIHELVKGESAPRLADEVLDLNQEVISSLAKQVIELFEKKTSVIYGVFKSSTQDFPNALSLSYQKNQNEDFISLTRSTMKSMQFAMSNTAGTGGYITFIEYSKGTIDYLLAVMIKNTKAFQLEKLKPKEAVRIDTSKLYQAININMPGYIKSLNKAADDGVRSYISFISKANEPSGYFLDAFSCKANVTPSKATAAAPRAAQNFLISCGVSKQVAKKAFYEVVDLLIENAEKPISINKIHLKVNQYLPDERYEELKDSFTAFAKSEDYQIPDVFQSKGKTAQGLRQIKGQGEGWELHFDKDMIGLKGKDVKKVFMYDSKLKQLYMPDIPEELKGRILTELNINENDE